MLGCSRLCDNLPGCRRIAAFQGDSPQPPLRNGRRIRFHFFDFPITLLRLLGRCFLGRRLLTGCICAAAAALSFDFFDLPVAFLGFLRRLLFRCSCATRSWSSVAGPLGLDFLDRPVSLFGSLGIRRRRGGWIRRRDHDFGAAAWIRCLFDFHFLDRPIALGCGLGRLPIIRDLDARWRKRVHTGGAGATRPGGPRGSGACPWRPRFMLATYRNTAPRTRRTRQPIPDERRRGGP